MPRGIHISEGYKYELLYIIQNQMVFIYLTAQKHPGPFSVYESDGSPVCSENVIDVDPRCFIWDQNTI